MALRLPLFIGAHRFLGPLFLSDGCRMIQVPVNHRPRPHGRSHYNLWNRSLRVVFDLFGVAWLMRRPMRYQVLEDQGRGYGHEPKVHSWAGDSSPGITMGEAPRMSSLNGWLVVGFLGQALFTARFVVQWLVSERNRDSVVPVAFWWFSLFGGLALLSYAVSRRDPVIIIGQAMGLVVYVRNLMLVAKARSPSGEARGSVTQERHGFHSRRRFSGVRAAPEGLSLLAPHQDRSGGHVLAGLDAAVRPADLNLINLVYLSQAEMDASIVVGDVTAATVSRADQRFTAGPEGDSRPPMASRFLPAPRRSRIR